MPRDMTRFDGDLTVGLTDLAERIDLPPPSSAVAVVSERGQAERTTREGHPTVLGPRSALPFRGGFGPRPQRVSCWRHPPGPGSACGPCHRLPTGVSYDRGGGPETHLCDAHAGADGVFGSGMKGGAPTQGRLPGNFGIRLPEEESRVARGRHA